MNMNINIFANSIYCSYIHTFASSTSSAVAALQSSLMESMHFFLLCFLSLCRAFPAAAASLLAGFLAANREEYG